MSNGLPATEWCTHQGLGVPTLESHPLWRKLRRGCKCEENRPIVRCMQSYTIGQAARLLGVSPDTARRWADAGRVTTRRDETGRRVIDGRDLATFSVELGQSAQPDEEEPHTSVRNSFPGIVTAVKLGDVAAQVEIQAGPHRLVSLLTREAAEELGLEVGMRATARVKSTNVHIDRA